MKIIIAKGSFLNKNCILYKRQQMNRGGSQKPPFVRGLITVYIYVFAASFMRLFNGIT